MKASGTILFLAFGLFISRTELRAQGLGAVALPTDDGAEQVVEVEPEGRSVTLHVFPNPACGRVVINAGGAILEEVRVFDLNAREVIARRGRHTPAEFLDLEELPTGVYIARVTTDKGVGTTRLVVE